ncbi:MAG: thioredoxin domain-containing protein [Verrucomicrobiales bacterium]|nr:thioredoxin domain-containing protein [Verrucomicrobiales bacterium]
MKSQTRLILSFLLLITPMVDCRMSAEEAKVRKPLPAKDIIAKLPKDGGEEFNRLIFSQSPYLLQHARNPVNWFPWGEEAFAEAKKQNKPVFLSIGYTTCHWCHVMEHESFEDEAVAALINEHFIPVKVDREERPDIDEVYMTVTQAMTGGGGWPMTVFMTPEKDPFFAGTYFPKESSAGRPGIKFIVERINEAWETDRANVVETATGISKRLGEVMTTAQGGPVPDDIFEKAFAEYQKRYDSENGGFSKAPKFPVPPNLMYLLRYHKRSGNAEALAMVEKTLKSMRQGGVYDQIGFGIHRYSTDPVWLVPHFEKMLYDQALATMAYVEAFQVTRDPFYSTTAREILSYVLRDMTHPEGGFYSAEDADSEGVEGKFYVWSVDEIREVLGKVDGDFYIKTFNLTEEGNFHEEATGKKTGDNIPHLREALSEADRKRIEPLRQKLFAHRETRVHPQKDDKILTDWNGLMIAAFARAGQALGEPEYINAAKKAADFVLANLLTDEGRLLKRYRQGEAGLTAHLEDYTFMIWALLDVYESTFDVTYLQHAIQLQKVTDQFFKDKESVGYFMTATDSEKLIVRAKKLYGGAIPGGNAVSVMNLSRLYRITGDNEYALSTESQIRAFSSEIQNQASVFPIVLCGLDFQKGPGYEIVISGQSDSPDVNEMATAIRKPYLPNKVILFRDDQNPTPLADLAPYTREQRSIEGKATAYVCRDFSCQLPTTDLHKVLKSLGAK